MIGYGVGPVTAGAFLIAWADAAAWWPVWAVGASLTAAGAVRRDRRLAPCPQPRSSKVAAALIALSGVALWTLLVMAIAITILDAKKHGD
jgi:hypothetical protein